MESDKLTCKFAIWVLLLQEYDFEVVQRARITNLNADGLSRNLSFSDEDLTGAKWHEDCDREAVSGWHAVAYLILFSRADVGVPIQGSDDETDRPQAITDIWEDFPILQKLQHGTFPSSTLAMERDKIGHQITMFRWKNGLLFRLLSDGTRRTVPRPDLKTSLVRQVHEELSHFGIHRTHSMLRGQYWWTSMY